MSSPYGRESLIVQVSAAEGTLLAAHRDTNIPGASKADTHTFSCIGMGFFAAEGRNGTPPSLLYRVSHDPDRGADEFRLLNADQLGGSTESIVNVSGRGRLVLGPDFATFGGLVRRPVSTEVRLTAEAAFGKLTLIAAGEDWRLPRAASP
jgi:hypothetical protein